MMNFHERPVYLKVFGGTMFVIILGAVLVAISRHQIEDEPGGEPMFHATNTHPSKFILSLSLYLSLSLSISRTSLPR
jgi:hypothetical protein